MKNTQQDSEGESNKFLIQEKQEEEFKSQNLNRLKSEQIPIIQNESIQPNNLSPHRSIQETGNNLQQINTQETIEGEDFLLLEQKVSEQVVQNIEEAKSNGDVYQTSNLKHHLSTEVEDIQANYKTVAQDSRKNIKNLEKIKEKTVQRKSMTLKHHSKKRTQDRDVFSENHNRDDNSQLDKSEGSLKIQKSIQHTSGKHNNLAMTSRQETGKKKKTSNALNHKSKKTKNTEEKLTEQTTPQANVNVNEFLASQVQQQQQQFQLLQQQQQLLQNPYLAQTAGLFNPYQQIAQYQMMALNPLLLQQQQQQMRLQYPQQYLQNPYMMIPPGFQQPYPYGVPFQQPQFLGQPQLNLAANLGQTQQQQIEQVLQQMKDSNQLPPQLEALLLQQEEIRQQIQQMHEENKALSQEIDKQDNIQTDREKDIQSQIDQKKKEVIEQRRKSVQVEETLNLIETMQSKDLRKMMTTNDDRVGVIDNLQANTLEGEVDGADQPLTKNLKQSMVESKLSDKDAEDIKEQNNENLQTKTLDQISKQAIKYSQDPTIGLENENMGLQIQIEQLIRREKELLQQVQFLESENDILYGKSNSMDHSIQKYGKRIEELSKQIDELNAILRVKDQDMLEITNEIHQSRMQIESMRKEINFRKQREEQLEINLDQVHFRLEKVKRESRDIENQMNNNFEDEGIIKEENMMLKESIENQRLANIQVQDDNNQCKRELAKTQNRASELERRIYETKQTIKQLQNENDQINVDVSYAQVTTKKQEESNDKLNAHYQSVIINSQGKGNLGLDLNVNHSDSFHVFNPYENQSARSNNRGTRKNFDQFYETKPGKRSASQEQKLLTQKSFNTHGASKKGVNMFEKFSTTNVKKFEQQFMPLPDSRVKTTFIDLTENQSNVSITGQNRRGQSRDFVNRNFVTQMNNILQWQEGDNDEQELGFTNLNNKKKESMKQTNMNVVGKTQRISQPENFEFKRYKRTNTGLSQQQQGYDNSDSFIQQPRQLTQNQVIKINKIQDDLANFEMNKEKIQKQIDNLQIKTKTRETTKKRISLEVELSQINQKIKNVKFDLKKLDLF